MPNEFEKIKVAEDGQEAAGDEEKKRQKRGGKGMMKAKKKDDGPKQVAACRDESTLLHFLLITFLDFSFTSAPWKKEVCHHRNRSCLLWYSTFCNI